MRYNSAMVLRMHGSHRKAIPLTETVEAWVLIFGIAVAVWLANSNVIASVVDTLGEYREVGAFISGLFFSSMLTTVPSIVALAEFAHYLPAWQLALLGGLGAIIGDFVIFRFVRSHLVDRIVSAAFSPGWRLIGRAISSGPAWWLGPVVGAIIIASPLPDELGLLMMGLSSIRPSRFLPIAFFANVAGIYVIAVTAQSLA